MLAIIMLMASIIAACNPDDGHEFPGNGKPASYEVKSDLQLPMSIFLAGILSPAMLDKESGICKALYRCLEKNDLTKGWSPVHPMKLHYSTQDMVVPRENSLAILEAFGSDIVTLQESTLPVDHATTCSLWMVELFSNGF